MNNIESVKTKQGNIYLEITSKCNLQCQYCYNDSVPSGSCLSLDIIKEIIDYSVESDCRHVAISGGEPFLHPDFLDIIKYASSKQMPLYIITNASIMSEEKLKELAPYISNLKFQLSFDGGNEKTHAISRGEKNFLQLLSCIDYFKKHDFMDHLLIRYNILPYNYMEIKAFISLMASQGCQAISFSYILPQGRGTLFGATLSDVVKDEIYSNVCSLKNDYTDINIDIKQKPVITCPYAIVRANQTILFSPRVDSCGNVYPCQVEVDSKFILGNLYSQTMKDILTSQKLKDYFKHVTRKEIRNKNCGQCGFKCICGGGCVAIKNDCNQMKKAMIRDFLHISD